MSDFASQGYPVVVDMGPPLPLPPTWPTANACIHRLQLIAPDVLPGGLLVEVQGLLAAVIAEFQSPVAPGGGGGTGRSFGAVTATRYFDGSGLAEQVVDDFDPAQAIVTALVNSPGSAYTQFTPAEAHRGEGYNLLVRQGNGVFPYFLSSGGLWPMGYRNLAVTATWGLPITADVQEAIKAEVAYRCVVYGFVALEGIGESVTLGDDTFNTASGVSVWAQSSPIAICHQTYMETVLRYRPNAGTTVRKMVRRRA